MKYNVEFPLPLSMSLSQAASWYRSMISMIPHLPVDFSGDSEHEIACERFRAYWGKKSMFRFAAAQSLVDQSLASEFLARLNLWSAEEYLGLAFIVGRGNRVFENAMALLIEVTEREKLAFPGTVGEFIGMRCQTTDGIYMMTADGWVKED